MAKAKYRVKEDVSVAIGTDPEVKLKAGTVEETEANRAALLKLVDTGLAELVKTTTKGD